jgi:uncharacterized protein (DUF849 family)
MADNRPVIIEAAINGATALSRNPNVPRSPEEIGREALACLDAGASVIHNHIEDITMTGEAAARRYGEGWKPVLAARPDAILCPTLTLCPDPVEAVAHLAPCAALGAAMAPLDPGSDNLCATGPDGLPGEQRFLYVNSYELIDQSVQALAGAGLGPSVAIYEPGFLRLVLAYHRAGRLPKGTMIKLYFCGDFDFIGSAPHSEQTVRSVGFGLPPTRKALDAYLDMLEGTELQWAVAVLGGDCIASEVARHALEQGGHLRVGLEDFGGPAQPGNVELVEQAAALCREVGRPVASCAEARAILGLR